MQEPLSPMGYRSLKSPNISSRKGTEVSSIVFHHTGHMALGPTLTWMQNKESGKSAHILIPRNEEEGIIQMVDFDLKAWHCGKAQLFKRDSVNLFSIGVQLVGTAESGFTDWQYEAAAKVCSDIMNQYPKVTFNRIVGHDGIADRGNGPGLFWHWDRFFDTLIRQLYDLKIERT